jgi:hypothetical protein
MGWKRGSFRRKKSCSIPQGVPPWAIKKDGLCILASEMNKFLKNQGNVGKTLTAMQMQTAAKD